MYSEEEIIEQIKEAVILEENMPANDGPAPLRSHWPEVVHDLATAYGSRSGPTRFYLDTQAIETVERVWQWLLWVDYETRILIREYCGGKSFNRLAKDREWQFPGMQERKHIHPKKLSRCFYKGIRKILKKL